MLHSGVPSARKGLPPPAQPNLTARVPSRTQRLQLRRTARLDRSRAPRHPPPGCRLAAAAAHRAALDQEDSCVRISAGVRGPFPRRRVRTPSIYSIPYATIEGLETYQKDTR